MQSLEQTNVGFLKLKPDFQPLRKLRVESSLESREDKWNKIKKPTSLLLILILAKSYKETN